MVSSKKPHHHLPSRSSQQSAPKERSIIDQEGLEAPSRTFLRSSWAQQQQEEEEDQKQLDRGDDRQMAMEHVSRLASERAVVVFTASNCSMGDVVTSLLSSLGVHAAVHDLDRDPRGVEMQRDLARRLAAGGGAGNPTTVPAVFVGGNLVGGTTRVLALHLAGELVPMLRNAGALWL